MNSLREDGSDRVCNVNTDCNEGSFSRTNEYEMECAMRSCHNDFNAENTKSTEEISMQNLNKLIQVGPYGLGKCEQSGFYLGIDKRMEELVTVDVVGVVFETLEKAEAFYYMYSYVLGFSVRKDDVRRDKHGSITLRRWVCSKEGQRRQKNLERIDRKREPRVFTRIGCCAAFRVSYSQKKGIWIAKEFVPNHTHGLTSNKGPLSQDLCLSTQVGSYGFRECEQSSCYLGIDKPMNELAPEDVVGVEFETLEKAEVFYFMYSNVVGFNVRRNDVRRNKHGSITLRRWVCSKEGKRRQKHLERIDRKREPRAFTRVGCSASFCVSYNRKTGRWVAKEFVSNHTHPWETFHRLSVIRPNRSFVSGLVQEKAKDKVEDGEKGNSSSVQQISSLRKEVGRNRGCYHNNDCQGSCGGRGNESELARGDMTSCHDGSSEENITSNKEDLSMQVENVGSSRDLSLQDLSISTQVGSYSLEICEQSNFCFDTDKFDDLTTENMVGVEFETLEKAEEFYYLYSRVIGFSVRKDDVKRDKHGLIFLRRWVCSKEGQRRKKHLERIDRKRKPKTLTRVGCCAAFRVNYNRKKGNWIVKEFVPTHTHQLAAAQESPSLKSNCNVKGLDLTQTETMDDVADGREGSTSDFQPGTSDVAHETNCVWDNVANGRKRSTSGVQPRTCDVVNGITLPPWTLKMPKIDKGTQLIKIPRVNEVEGLPLPEGVQHVNAETVTILLQMISGLREVVLETILRARDKLKEATEKVHQKDSEIAELRAALEVHKHADVYEGSEDSNNDEPAEERTFGDIINLNEVDGNRDITEEGGEVGGQNKNGHGSGNGIGIYYNKNSKKKHKLKDVETSDQLPKKAKTNL